MNGLAASRFIRCCFVALLALAVLAFGLFGRVTIGAGLYAGSRERVAVILWSADAAMEALGISAAWRAVTWWSGGIALVATLALILVALRPTDDCA